MVRPDTAAGTGGPAGSQADRLDMVLRGDIPQLMRRYAEERIGGLSRYTTLTMRHARLRVTEHGNAATRRPVTVQASAQFDGRRIGAQVAAATAQEGIDLLVEVLRHRLSRLEQHGGQTPPVAPHGWRHSSEQTHRPDYAPRPADERKVLRHKAFELALCTPDEAIADMELMGYRFRLFTDLATGQDSIVYRFGPVGYRLAQVKPEPGHAWRGAAAMTINPYPAARLSLAQAMERLNLVGWPFLFYADEVTGRGRVLYRRYDGHYGLITPVGG